MNTPLRYHFIRTLFEDKKIYLKKIYNVKNPINILTKVVTEEILKLYLALISVQEG